MNYIKVPMGAIAFLFLVACAHTKKAATDPAGAKQVAPKLIKPVARRVWIEPQVLENGAVYVDGHWKYVIQKDSSWTK